MNKHLSTFICVGFFGFGAWVAASYFETIAGKGFAVFTVLFIRAVLDAAGASRK